MTVDQWTMRANQQGNLTSSKNGTPVQFFSSLLIGYRKTAGMSSLREDTPAGSTKNHARRQKTLGTSLIPPLLRSDFSTRNASEDRYIRHSIAPDPVRAVDAACDFACRVEPFNRLSGKRLVLTQKLSNHGAIRIALALSVRFVFLVETT